MIQKRVSYKDNIISYEQSGSGQNYLFAFHGYGQAAYRWEIITQYLDSRFTLIAFDLPFHGDTSWNRDDRFTPQALLEIIRKILPPDVTRFYLLGYSMGGRIALGLLQLAPALIKKIVLLAPDGLHRNRWYRFATHTTLGRQLFYNAMKNPAMLLQLAKQLKKRGVIGDTYLHMAQHYMYDAGTRMQLYYRWIMTRDFHPDLAILKQEIVKHRIPVDMVFAKHDRIMIADHGIDFIKGLEKQVNLHIIDAGHAFLYSPHARYIASFFDEAK